MDVGGVLGSKTLAIFDGVWRFLMVLSGGCLETFGRPLCFVAFSEVTCAALREAGAEAAGCLNKFGQLAARRIVSREF